MCDVAEAFSVDFENLIARLQAAVSGGSAVGVHFVDEDGALKKTAKNGNDGRGIKPGARANRSCQMTARNHRPP